jgi:hypothetical protein
VRPSAVALSALVLLGCEGEAAAPDVWADPPGFCPLGEDCGNPAGAQIELVPQDDARPSDDGGAGSDSGI